jgi:hypothetical protein
VERARQAVESGEAASVSAYVAQAMSERARREDLASVLSEMLAESGVPMTKAERAAADRLLRRRWSSMPARSSRWIATTGRLSCCSAGPSSGATRSWCPPESSQVWRDPACQVRLVRFLNANGVEIAALDGETARAAGQLLGARDSSDVIDATVVVLAHQYAAAVVTSDVDDIRRLSASLGIIAC